MKIRGHLLAIFLLLSVGCFAQVNGGRSYQDIRSDYEDFPKNEVRAMPFVSRYIVKAKKDSDFTRLTQGYRDAVFFSPSNRDKLIYSDSMIFAALNTKDEGLISLAYLGKGIVYYFNYKKYEPALDEYLKAYEYSKKADDPYLSHKVIYHLGVIKSYLGYYEDAVEHFDIAVGYFESQIKKELHPNEIFNDKRGYYNSLHQMIICHRQLGHFKKADSLISVGLVKLNNEKDFSLERSYLLKCRGISNLNHNNYEGAVIDLNNALPELMKNDFAWASVACFYLGKSYWPSDKKEALKNFRKVDSIFIKHRFILPEVRENYELLISHYRSEKDFEKELYYTNQLLSVDSIIAKDFTYLSSRIHREYDRNTLLEKKEYLENRMTGWIRLVVILSVLLLCFLVLAIYRLRKERSVKMKYQSLQERLNAQQSAAVSNAASGNPEARKSVLSVDIVRDIAANILLFEQRKGYLKKGLSLSDLATVLKTNTSYLSIYINEYVGGNFKSYINTLRIAYLTDLLNSDRKYLNYTIEALAGECGMSRQNFSDLFYEINGIRPNDYIRNRKEELGRK